MRDVVARFTSIMAAVILLGPVGAAAQQRDGGVLDVLKDVLRGDRKIEGHVVVARDGHVVVRGEDNRTYQVSTGGLDASTLGRLSPGQPVTVETRGATQQGTVTAASIQPRSGEPKRFERSPGTVKSVEGERVTFETEGGFTIPVDLSRIAGARPTVQPGQRATLYYEQAPSAVAAVWLEPGTAGAAGAPYGSPSASPSTAPPPGASPGAGSYQRLHGYVESVGLGTVGLKTDDGRSVTVDVSQVADDVRRSLRPGDIVGVVGKSQGDRFVAELIQRDR